MKVKITDLKLDETKERGHIRLIDRDDVAKKVAGYQALPPPGPLRVTAWEDSGMTRFAFDQRHFFSLLWYMICVADGSLYVLNGQHGTETCRAIQDMRLAEGKELEDWQEFGYVDIVRYKTPRRIRAKVAKLQQAGSQSVTWIPLSEALDNMLLYIEDGKREKEPQDFERFNTAVVQAAVNSAFLAPESLEEPRHTVCVRVSHGYSARGLLDTVFPRRTRHSRTGGTSSSWRITAAVRRLLVCRTSRSKSKKEDVTRNAFKKLEELYLPSLLQKVCAHMNLKDSTLGTTQNYTDARITEQWVTFHLDHPDNKDYVNQTAGMCQFCTFSARGFADSNTSFTSAQLPMRRSEQKSQRRARRN